MIVVALLATLIGLALGTMGGGGSILTVPLFTEVAGLGPKVAIATSLFVVAATSLVAAVSHARVGNVRWRVAFLFGPASMAGAYAGARLAQFIPGGVLMVLFAGMMLATGLAMLRRGRGKSDGGSDDAEDAEQGAGPRPFAAITEGVLVGLFTGMVGAGGGFLVVPALVLLGRIPMHAAVGTSLVVIAMKSTAGLWGYLSHVEVDWTLALVVSAVAAVASIGGQRIARRLPAAMLQQGFAIFVLAIGAWVMWSQFS